MTNPLRPMPAYHLSAFALLLTISLRAQSTELAASPDPSVAGLRRQIEEIVRSARGRVGVAATLIETGKSVSMRGEERFPMQSVYKFPIGMAVLQQVDQGKLTLGQRVHVDKKEYVSNRQHSPLRDKHPEGADVTVSDLLRYAVSESDGSASDVLMRLAGGASAVTHYLRSLGITGMAVIDTEQELGRDNAVQYRNWAQPEQAVALLRALQSGRGLSTSSRALLLHLMTETPTGPRRIKGQLPTGTVVAHKTGTSWTIEGVTAATNDVGLITLPNGQHVALAIFVTDSPADETTREQIIARIARAVWDYWH